MVEKTCSRLLVVAAHPDDETLGCGGLIARTVRSGGTVAVLILTEGSTTQYPDRPDLVERKETEARTAADKLGVASVQFGHLPDMRLATLAPADLNAPVERSVRQFEPQWVAVHHSGDLNSDHVLAHEAARIACRPGSDVQRLLAYETLSSTEWGVRQFEPDVYVSLEERDLTAKLEAFSMYESEARDYPHPRSSRAIRSLATTRGSQAGFEFAEAFESVWHRM